MGVGIDLGPPPDHVGNTGTDLAPPETIIQNVLSQNDTQQLDFLPWNGMGAESSLASFGFLLHADNIDLDGLDLAILSATGDQPEMLSVDDDSSRTAVNEEPRSEQAAEEVMDPSLQPAEAVSGYSDTAIKRSWHTYCGHEPSTRATPDPSQGLYHVDEACHTNLANKLKPRVQDGTLPSVAFLVIYNILHLSNSFEDGVLTFGDFDDRISVCWHILPIYNQLCP